MRFRLKGFNIKNNPAIFSFLSAFKGFKPVNYKNKFDYLKIGEKDSLDIQVLKELYPNGNFYSEDVLQEKPEKQFDIVFVSDDFCNVSKERKEQILDILEKNLKESGYIFLNFSSLPANSTVYAFKDYLYSISPTKEEVENLIKIFSERPSIFVLNNEPVRKAILNYLDEKNPKKDKFSKDFSPKYFYEVYQSLSSLNIDFVGRLDLPLNDPEISLFPSHLPTVAKFSKDIKAKETTIDVILNVDFHEDLWVKEGETGEFYDFIAENFYLLPRQKVENIRKVLLLPGGHRHPLTAPIYEFFYYVGDNPIRLSEHPDFKGNKNSTAKAFFKLAASGEYFICVKEGAKDITEVKDKLEGKISLTGINYTLVENGFNNLNSTFLVSDIVGGAAVFLTPLETVLLKFACEYEVSKSVEKSYEYLQSINKDLTVKGEVKKSKEIEKKELEKVADILFKGRKAENLQRLNIVEL